MSTKEIKRRKVKIWTLDDGSKYTTEEVMSKVGCVYSTAFARLVRSSNPEKIFKSKAFTRSGRTYTLDDGSQWTTLGLAKHLGIKRSLAGTRLSLWTDPERVMQDPKRVNVEDRAIKAIQSERMFFDPIGHWALINKNT